MFRRIRQLYLYNKYDKYAWKKAKKFFPVLSSDISPDIITESKKGNILLHKNDLDYLQKTNALKYFERNNNKEVQIMRGIEFFPFRVKSELLDKIDFSVKDVRKEVMENDFSDSVFSSATAGALTL